MSIRLYGILLLSSLATFAQDRASLVGTVFDASRAVIGDAAVEVRAEATGQIRTVPTSAEGIYRIGSLPVGAYQLTVKKPGFQTKKLNAVQLEVGQTRTLDIVLEVTQEAATVEVTAESVTLNQTSADVSKVISGSELRNLPVNGRDWNAFLVLAPGAINSGDGSQRSVRFLGRSKDDTNYTFDGIDATAVKEGPQMVALRTVISNDSVAEFKVNSGLYTAEYGFYMGGQVSFVSRSGGNEFHGSVFEFLRNDYFDARRFLDVQKPPFRMNQFGGSFGGPVLRNRAFFFANYEGLRQRLGQTQIGFVPNATLRARIVSTSPALRPLVDLYPPGMEPASATTDRISVVRSQVWDENSGMFRIDHRLSDKASAYVRYNTANGLIRSPLSIFAFNQFSNQQTLATHNAVAQLQQVFSATMLNELKLGFNRANNTRLTTTPLAESINVVGLVTLPGRTGGGDPGNTYSIVDNFAWTRGRHTLKFGAEVRALQVNIYQFGSASVSYPNVDAYVANRVDSVGINGEFGTRGVRSEVYMAYAQDEWKIKPNLTANLGLRYEFYVPLYEQFGRARIWALQCGGICPEGSDLYAPDYNNWAPRVSLAWSPRRFKDRTTFRAGAGIYYQMGQVDDLLGPIESVNTRANLTGREFPALAYPVDRFVQSATLNVDAPRALGIDRRDFKSYQFGFFLDQRLPLDFQLQTGYTGVLGRNLIERTYQNVNFIGTNSRPLPEFGIIDQKLSGSISNFHGLQVSLNRRFRNGWLWGTQYLWSRAMDDGAVGSNEASYPQNVACRSCEYARGAFDVRHNLNVSSVYALPFGRGQRFATTGFGAAILGNWELSGILTARTGRPIDVVVTRTAAVLPDGNNRSRQRPNYVGGSLTPPAGQSANGWINFDAFAVPSPGTWGNLGRNVLDGPGLFQLDAALTRRQPLTERINLSFRFEMFNVTNRAQLGQPSNNISAGRNLFGLITSPLNAGATGTGTSRQLQFMLRLDF